MICHRTRVSRHVEERKKRVDWVYRNNDINIVLVEQTSQKVNKTLCIRLSTETKRNKKRYDTSVISIASIFYRSQ